MGESAAQRCFRETAMETRETSAPAGMMRPAGAWAQRNGAPCGAETGGAGRRRTVRRILKIQIDCGNPAEAGSSAALGRV